MMKKLSEQEKIYRAKIATNNRLAKKALIDKPKWNPPKGKKYLKDVKIGSIIRTGCQTAVLIDKNNCACRVLVMDAQIDDSSYYTGKRQWANNTHVEVIEYE